MPESPQHPSIVSIAAADGSTGHAGGMVRARARARSRVRYHAALKLVRRAHLFAWLFMKPWVFLYGVTGFLFKHPDAFPDREVRAAGRAELEGTPLEGFPTANELAARVVEAINARAERPSFRLVGREGATFSRALFVTATGGGREHSVRFDPDTGEAFIRSTTAAAPDPKAWPGGTHFGLADPPRDRLARGVPALLAKVGVEADATTVRNPPDLICTVEREGRRWRVAYNLQTGAIAARPANGPGDRLSTRRFLTGMHLAFTYPSHVDIRWFWAVAVDSMFVAMLFWGLSGLLMWWQMKKLRLWGIVTLILSAATATVLAVGMHAALASRV
jgi:hypothetical protein